MDDKRNILLAVILTAGILFGWPVISGYFFPAANPPVTKVQGGKETPLPQTQTAPAAESAQAIRDRAVVLRESPRVAIDTPKLKGSINLKGARIDDIVLPTHKETIAKDSPPVRLFSPSGTSDAYFESDIKEWDVAAGALIATEAGAAVHHIFDGFDPTVVVAAAPIAEAFVDFIRRHA